jgi:signal transduction histidine kinase
MNTQEQNHQVETGHPETFSINDLMDELFIYVKEKLQNSGKSEIEVSTLKFRDNLNCRIHADRVVLKQALVHLLDNAVKYIKQGFNSFGFYVLNDTLVDFYVHDTRFESYDDAEIDLSVVHNLLQLIGSRLKNKYDSDSTLHFSIKCDEIEIT